NLNLARLPIPPRGQKVRAGEHHTFIRSFKEKMVSTIQSEADRLKRHSMKTVFKRRPKPSYQTKSLIG
ncbi:MAG: hypothetical protein QF600_06910, partial [Verrucomicrobiota bacterium]|nr:hypothetical protein [Verrucomicrobiota bacterium]